MIEIASMTLRQHHACRASGNEAGVGPETQQPKETPPGWGRQRKVIKGPWPMPVTSNCTASIWAMTDYHVPKRGFGSASATHRKHSSPIRIMVAGRFLAPRSSSPLGRAHLSVPLLFSLREGAPCSPMHPSQQT